MPYLTNDGQKIYYCANKIDAQIDREWVTLINGHGRTHTDFNNLIKLLNNNGFNCLTLDNRGVGKSVSSASFSLTAMAEDIERIWRELGIKNTHIIGISMGGIIAQLTAIKYPSQIKTIALISTTNSKKWISSISSESWGNNIDDVKSKMKYYFSPDFIEKNKLLVNAIAKEMLRKLSDQEKSHGLALQRKAMEQISDHPGSHTFNKPMLIMHGIEDQIIDIGAARSIKDQNKHADLIELKGVGHLLLAECAQTFYQHYLGFLKKQGI